MKTNYKEQHFCKICHSSICWQTSIYGDGRCRSCSQKGRINSLITRNRISKGLRKKWSDSHWKSKMCKVRSVQMTEEVRTKITKKLQSRTMTGLEKQVNDVILSHKLPFKFVGDGSFILHGFNPDFINCNGKKQIIEVYYSYFKKKQYGSENKYKRKRYAIFREYGFNTIFFNENQLGRLTEKQLVDTLIKFSKGV
jgi:hypothetical protein